jgi:hypothetical protein
MSQKTWGRQLSKIDMLGRPTKQDWANQFQIRRAGPTSPALLFLRIPDAAIVEREPKNPDTDDPRESWHTLAKGCDQRAT